MSCWGFQSTQHINTCSFIVHVQKKVSQILFLFGHERQWLGQGCTAQSTYKEVKPGGAKSQSCTLFIGGVCMLWQWLHPYGHAFLLQVIKNSTILCCCRWFPALLHLYWHTLLRNLINIWDAWMPVTWQGWSYQEGKHVFPSLIWNVKGLSSIFT